MRMFEVRGSYMKRTALSLLLGIVIVVANQALALTFTYPDIMVDSPTATYDHETQLFDCGNDWTGLTMYMDASDAGSQYLGGARLNASIDEDGNLIGTGPNYLTVWGSPIADTDTFSPFTSAYADYFTASIVSFYMEDACTYIFDFSVTSGSGTLGNSFAVGSSGYVNFTDFADPPFTSSFVIPAGTMDIHYVPDGATTSYMLGLAFAGVALLRRRLLA
jgi:hypothetical protein